MRGKDFAELRAFLTVVDRQGFAPAARQLGVSASALSQTIKRLEERLGVRLLNRTTRSVAPSQAGELLIARLRPIFADLDEAVGEVASLGERPSGRLRINLPQQAAQQHIGPILGRFLTAYPDIAADLVVDDRLVDIVSSGFDAGIRLGERVEQDMIAIPVGHEAKMMVVASPSYLATNGAPLTPHDLRDHGCINLRWPTDLSVYRWEFERDGKAIEVAVEGSLIVNDPVVATRCAIDGVGIAYLFDYYARDGIASGELVQLLAEWTPPFPGFYLYYPSRRLLPPPLRAFIDFLRGA